MYSRREIITKVVFAYEELESQAVAIGDVLISVSKDAAYNSALFTQRLRSFQTHVLSKLFPSGLKVVTRSDYGRLHCHCAVELPCGTDGFDWESFDESERWYKLYKATGEKSCLKWYKFYTKRYRSSLPEELQKLNHTLRSRAKTYGLGHIFVIPVRKNATALKWYLVGNIPEKRQKRDKGVHYFTSWGLEKASNFKSLSKGYNEYRDRLKIFAQGLHLNSDNYSIVLKDILGNNWHWKCRDYIKDIAMLPEGLYLPPNLKDAYEELRKTVKQQLVRIGQYAV